MNYPLHHCHFCGGEMQYSCLNADCFNKHYYSIGFDRISFLIEEWNFNIFYDSAMPHKMRIVNEENLKEKYYLNYHLFITKENYLDQISRLRNLSLYA